MREAPPRLKDTAQSAPELRAALEALRDAPQDAARIGRVAEKLTPLFEAPAPSAALAGRALRVGPSTLKALRLFVVGAAVGATVLGVMRGLRTSQEDASHASAKAVAARFETGTSARAAAPSATVEPAPSAQQPLPELSSDRAPSAHARAVPPSRHPSERVTNARSANSRAVTPRAIETTSAEPAVPPSAERRPAAASLRKPTEDVLPEPPETPAQPARKNSEVELLFAAQQLQRTSPQKALALLDEHAARFADGMLAPEREAMAIEILRALGQRDAAAQRLARYRVRYPDSLHLPGLLEK